MAGEPISRTSDSEEVEALRRRIADLEEELTKRTQRTNAALAAAQDRSYWLDRWGVDLNAIMRRRGAAELRAGLRAARALYRSAYDLRSKSKRIPDRLRSARAKLEEERSRG